MLAETAFIMMKALWLLPLLALGCASSSPDVEEEDSSNAAMTTATASDLVMSRTFRSGRECGHTLRIDPAGADPTKCYYDYALTYCDGLEGMTASGQCAISGGILGIGSGSLTFVTVDGPAVLLPHTFMILVRHDADGGAYATLTSDSDGATLLPQGVTIP